MSSVAEAVASEMLKLVFSRTRSIGARELIEQLAGQALLDLLDCEIPLDEVDVLKTAKQTLIAKVNAMVAGELEYLKSVPRADLTDANFLEIRRGFKVLVEIAKGVVYENFERKVS